MGDHVRSYAVADLPGDGIGPEVSAVARSLVDQAGQRHGFTVDWRPCPLGSDYYLRTGQVLPDDILDDLRKTDAIMLGAVGSPSVPPGVLERGLLLRLRFELDLYINLRPASLRPGVVSRGAPGLDLFVVRENTEGLYAGAGGIAHRGSAFEVATEESLNTRAGVERCVRYAASLAAKRSGGLTLVHKTNVLVNAGNLWMRVAEEVAAEQGVSLDYCHVDAACLHLVENPGRFDVIVTDNLFGDIISDLAAALTGGLGLSPSGNLNPDRTGPSMFEPVHGSAPDIAGTGKASPAAAVLSAALMLDHLGEAAAAAGLDAAVNAVLGVGGAASTQAWADALAAQLANTGVDR
ncbi:MAG TPA: 3-isopropylmalate dehydrogenase [Streptosporangiaceae bacterium]|nr:3-isopropylmalate dehydrogenase [Streptosporangiaceae bacterium]